MSTATIETLTKMLEAFPESVQDQAMEQLCEYLTVGDIWDSIAADSKNLVVTDELRSELDRRLERLARSR